MTSPLALPGAEPTVARAADERRPHLLTVSVEEWFHGGALAGVVQRKHWERFESRLDRAMDAALGLLDSCQARATFFVLGMIAERQPEIVRRIVDSGHEVASRGFWPRGVADMDRSEFLEDLARTSAAIEAAAGVRPLGYRSPRWLSHSDLWVLEELARQGYAYDSSVNPVGRQFLRRPEYHTTHRHAIDGTPGIVEVPISTMQVPLMRVAIAGGNWMRQLPEWLLSRAVAKWDRSRSDPLVFYFTSWELDKEQPQITAASRLNRIRQYRNLSRVRGSLERYLHRYRFMTIADYLGLQRVAAGRTDVVRAAPTPGVPAVSNVAATRVALVIPMFREKANVPFLMRTLSGVEARLLPRYRLQIVLVDDGSKDGTFEAMQENSAGRENVILLRHEKNQGVAAAIMTGIRAADTDLVCSIDCDCSYDPMELEHMLASFGEADLVTASPYHPDGRVVNVPGWRLFLSRGLSMLYRRTLRAPVHTWTSCFRVYRRAAVADLQLENGGFLGVAEVLIRVLRRGGIVREHPAQLESRLLGFSKMKTLRTIRGHLGLLWRIVRRRL